MVDRVKTFVKNIPNYIKKLFKCVNWCGVDANTYVRIIIQIITLVNYGLSAVGKNPLPCSESSIYTWVSFGLFVASSAVNAYKNNSTSKEAQAADNVMKELKSLDAEQSEKLISQIADLIDTTKLGKNSSTT